MPLSAPIDIALCPTSIRFDLTVAVVLALILTIGWAWTDWSNLSHMLLPDWDDMMRLAQVRDWLGGQGTNDWTQYRMAPPRGSPMHWSRINDLGITTLILLATPFVGRPDAELFAVLVYPGALFAIALFLSARIGRRLWGQSAGPVAAVVTALAYPGTTVFIPGRIDHHALQVVLIQMLVLMLVRAPNWRSGLVAGATAAVSLVVGLETAPQVAVLIGVVALLWVFQGREERSRLAGFAAGLGAGTIFFLVFLRPTYWSSQFCDAFTPASSTAVLAVAAALALLSGANGILPGWRSRLGAGVIVGAVAAGGTLLAFPSCVDGPYGEVDPFLRAAFIRHIEEANGIFALERFARIIGVGGALTAACAASVWMLLRQRARWTALLPIVSVVVMSALVMLFQVRSTYIGAPLGAPVLAGLILAARQRASAGLPAVIAAWLGSSGLVYAAVPQQLERFADLPEGRATIDANRKFSCNVGDTWAQVDHYPAGVIMAGTSVAAYVIGATHHSTVGAGYHRNNDGNMAMYRFFLSAPDRSRQIAREWNIDYVVFCPGDFGEIGVTHTFPNSLAAHLQRGQAPSWLEPAPLRGAALRFYKLR